MTAASRGAAALLDQALAAVQARHTRAAVHAALVDALGVLRNTTRRWAPTADRRAPEHDPAHYAHAWRALADDLQVLADWTARAAAVARAEQARHEQMSGDTR